MVKLDSQKPWVVLPFKSVKTANSRLRPILSPTERQEVSLFMIKDVVSVLQSSVNLGGLLIVTHCPIIKAYCENLAATFLEEDGNPQLNSAITKAVQFLDQLGVQKFFTVPGDVPLLSLSELDRLIQCVQESRGITLVPSHDGLGTNSLASSIPIRISPQFGVNSLSVHHQIAKDHDVSVEVLSLRGLGFDIDEPGDLIRLISISGNSRTQRYLSNINLDRRSSRFAEVNDWGMSRSGVLM
jgi:2-phospho-L-lactate guanylyltransferase